MPRGSPRESNWRLDASQAEASETIAAPPRSDASHLKDWCETHRTDFQVIISRRPVSQSKRRSAPQPEKTRTEQLSVISEEGTLLEILCRDGKPEFCDRHPFGESPTRTTVAVACTQHFCRLRAQLTCFRQSGAIVART